MMQNDLELLRRIAIFGALKQETLTFLLSRATTVAVAAGEVFFQEGDPGGDLYVLEAGSVRVTKKRRGDGADLEICRFGPGDCFGEASLLAVMPRSATVTAEEACSALRVRNGDLLALHKHDLEQFALLILNLGRDVARRLWRTDQLLLDFEASGRER